MSPMKKPTPRQNQALRFIRDFIRLHGHSPSEAELARHLCVTAAAVHDLIVRLERAGHIRRLPGIARSIAPCAGASELEREANAIVLLAFRNGPLEDIHAGQPCPHCVGNPRYSHITDDEMKSIMKTAANRVFTLLTLKDARPAVYEQNLRYADLQVTRWDVPELVADFGTHG